jgi:hypothetical protein
LVPCRERPLGGQVKEFGDEDGSHLCQSPAGRTKPKAPPCRTRLSVSSLEATMTLYSCRSDL